jgi:16S rRNA (cytidine1402-2'-O)-methyltransferase
VGRASRDSLESRAFVLYICPTPIGNLEDVTLRVLTVLRSVDLIACEDTRHTRILLDCHGIATRLVSFHEHNEEQRLGVLLPLLREGKRVAVVSDAGMPGLSDPGFTLVRACAAEGLPVTVLPGPSAVPTAVVASGLPTDRFAFIGFLPRGAKKLVEQIAAFDSTGAAVVAFEAPRRLTASLTAIAARWPERRLAVCRELTKLHEQVIRGTAGEVQAALPRPLRGEIVLVLEPAARQAGAAGGAGGQAAGWAGRTGAALEAVIAGDDKTRAALRELLACGLGTKKAASIVAGLTGLSKRQVYALALGLRAERRP